MTAKLKLIYLLWVIPAALLVIGVEASKMLGLPLGMNLPPWTHGTVFVLSALTSLAGPILIRTWFVHTHRESMRVPPGAFIRFQTLLLRIALVTPYFAAAALFFGFPRFYAAGIVLLALYAAYYYYPSARRIDFDKRVFRVNHGSEKKA